MKEIPLVPYHLGSTNEGHDSLWWNPVSDIVLLCASHSKLDMKAVGRLSDPLHSLRQGVRSTQIAGQRRDLSLLSVYYPSSERRIAVPGLKLCLRDTRELCKDSAQKCHRLDWTARFLSSEILLSSLPSAAIQRVLYEKVVFIIAKIWMTFKKNKLTKRSHKMSHKYDFIYIECLSLRKSKSIETESKLVITRDWWE